MTQKKENSIALIAGILFAVLFISDICSLFLVFQSLKYYYLIIEILKITANAAICFSLFTKRKNIVLYAWTVLAIIYLMGSHLYGLFFSWLYAFGYIVAVIICVAELTDYIPKLRAIGKKVWFVPAIFFGPSAILSFVLFIENLYFRDLYFELLLFYVQQILLVAAVFLFMMWIVYPEGLPNKAKQFENNAASSNNVSSSEADEMMYCDLVKHILLLLFTFGIWFLIWIYRITGYTNSVKDVEERNPTTKLLLCIFVPFYQIYWTYNTAQRIDKMASAKGLQSDLSTLCLISAFLVPIIPPILMQDKINNIVTTGTMKVTLAQKPQIEDSTVLGTAEELKKYKELLDSGVITQEEFDAKKKQLLGI